MPDSPAQVATTPQGGCVIRLAGRATMQHSGAVEELVVQTMRRHPATRVAIDLTDCSHLDSTFLGSLFGLYQRFGPDSAEPRLTLHASPANIKALFGPLKLDRFIRTDPSAAPATSGQWVPLEAAESSDPKSMSRHVMECHRRLAEVDTPARAAFTRIADAMEQELAKQPG